MNTRERERGRNEGSQAKYHDRVVPVGLEELAKLRTLLDSFLDANPNDKIVVEHDIVHFNRHNVIRNLEDVQFVIGYLEGLST